MPVTPRARIEDYSHRLLETDAALLAANDSHVVVAIRVSRDALGRNHHLLADLSDASTGNDTLNRFPTTSPQRRRAFSYLGVGMLTGAAFFIGWILPTAPFMVTTPAVAGTRNCARPRQTNQTQFQDSIILNTINL